MPRFLMGSPRTSERGRRYAALPSQNDEDHPSHVVPSELPAQGDLEQGSGEEQPAPSMTLSLVSAAAENNEGETGLEEEEGQFENAQRTIENKAESGSIAVSNDASEDSSQQDDLSRNTADAIAPEGPAQTVSVESKEGRDEKEEEELNNAVEEELEEGNIRIRILDLNGKFYNIICQLDWNVALLKKSVFEETEIAMESQRLIYRGRVLEDDKVLEDYKVEDGHTIHLFVRMAQTPEPEGTNSESSNSNTGANGIRSEDEMGMTIVHVSSETVSSAVFPSDSARRVDPLMLDCPLGNAARRVKLWSSFFLIIYTMKVMGQFALLANDQHVRKHREDENDDNNPDPYDRFSYPPYANQDPMISAVELMIHAFGVYLGCVGFKAAHDTDVRPIRLFCRGLVWLAILTIGEQIFVTAQVYRSDYPNERVQYPYGGQMPSKDDIVSANVFQAIMLAVMWVIAVHHAYVHQTEVRRYNESFAQAAMNAYPVPNGNEVV